VNKEAIQRLREPAAWVLTIAAGLHVLAGLVMLLAGRYLGGGTFTLRAMTETLQLGLITGVAVTVILVVAVLLATWEPAAKQARTIVLAALGVFGVALAFGVISWLAGLVADTGGVEGAAVAKFSIFLYGAAKLAVMGVGAWFVFTVFQGMKPAAPAPQVQQGYPDYGYQQGGYPQPPQAGYQQPQQGNYVHSQYQQPQQGYPQPPQAGYQQPQQGPYQQPQQGGQSLEEESAGEWTRAYGGGQQQSAPGYGQQEQQGPENGGEWYRDSRPQQ